MNYFEELTRAMTKLGQHPKAIFVGQSIQSGSTMSDSFKGVPAHKILEFPVAEDLQLGFCIGLALEGWLPVCCYLRWNFFLLAFNQLINHLDRIPIYSVRGYMPKMILRVAMPVITPFDPGPQHNDDFAAPVAKMLRTISIRRIKDAGYIEYFYDFAVQDKFSTIMVEYTDLYNVIPSNVKEKEAA